MTSSDKLRPGSSRDTDRNRPRVTDPEVRSAAGPVLAIMAVTTLLLLARCARYDYFGDELYFLSAGRRLSPGYVDQGPVVPLLARTADLIAPNSLLALRIPSILAGAAAIAVTAATARELGGGRTAQALAALAYAGCPFLITQTATLSTFAFDSTLSATAVWLLIRWTAHPESRWGAGSPADRQRSMGWWGHRDRLLVSAALVVAVDLQVKLLSVVLLTGLGIGVLVAGPRSMLRRPALWAGSSLVIVSAAPLLWWQYDHGWPQLAMGAVVDQEQRAATGGVGGLPIQFALLAGLLGVPLALIGFWTLSTAPIRRPYRFVAIAAATDLVFVLVVDGRPYYLAGFLPVLFAAGTTQVCSSMRRIRSSAPGAVLVGLTALTTVLAIAIICVLPLPASRLHDPTESRTELSTRMRLFGTTGWTHLAAAVITAYGEIPTERREHTVVITQNYWQAAALENLATPTLPVYSPSRGFAMFGIPSDTATTALYVTTGSAEASLRRSFSDVTPLIHLDDRLGFPGIDRGVTVWRCDRPLRPWPTLWAEVTTYVFDDRSLP